MATAEERKTAELCAGTWPQPPSKIMTVFISLSGKYTIIPLVP
jgi:hypothetical protein